MRISESRLRRIIRSVINESEYPMTTHDREVNNRKWREFDKDSGRQDPKKRQVIMHNARHCANFLFELFTRADTRKIQGFTGDPETIYNHLYNAAYKKSEESRKFLLELTLMSTYTDYLESEVFWENVAGTFHDLYQDI